MSPDAEPCATFTQSAQKRGLLESDDIYYEAMNDACVEKSNFTQLQRYFAMLLFHSRPSNPRKFFEKYIDEMNPPISVNNPNIEPKSKESRGAEILRNLEYFFRGLGTSCLYVVLFFLFQIMLYCIFYVLSEMGLPAVPNDFDFQEQSERIESDEFLNDFYGAERNRTSPEKFVFNQVEKLNKDQRAAFDRISSAILEGNDHRLFFVEGAGGCGKLFRLSFLNFHSVVLGFSGKTYLYNTLIRWILAGKPSIAAMKLLSRRTEENHHNQQPDSTPNSDGHETSNIKRSDGTETSTLETHDSHEISSFNSSGGTETSIIDSSSRIETNIIDSSGGTETSTIKSSGGTETSTIKSSGGTDVRETASQQPLLNKGKVAAAASTGIAALLLIGGGTVHRQFNVPNDVDDKTQPRMNAESKRAEQLRNADLIIIDVIFLFFFTLLRQKIHIPYYFPSLHVNAFILLIKVF